MAESLAEKTERAICQASELYHRLILLVAPVGAGKSAALHELHDRAAAPLINVNLELSRRMLDLTGRQRGLQLPHPSPLSPGCLSLASGFREAAQRRGATWKVHLRSSRKGA